MVLHHLCSNKTGESFNENTHAETSVDQVISLDEHSSNEIEACTGKNKTLFCSKLNGTHSNKNELCSEFF